MLLLERKYFTGFWHFILSFIKDSLAFGEMDC